jgi:hypothetical protein
VAAALTTVRTLLNYSCRYAKRDDESEKNKKNGVLWDVPPCGSWKNRRFGGTRIGELGTTLAVTSNRRTLFTWYFFAAYVGC